MITIRNDSLTAEDIAKAEELQRRYVERTRREWVPNSPSSTLYVPVSTGLDQNEDFYKRRETTYSPQVTAGYMEVVKITNEMNKDTLQTEEGEEPVTNFEFLNEPSNFEWHTEKGAEEESEEEETEEEEAEEEEEEESEEAVLIWKTVKELKDIYRERGWRREVRNVNNKQYLVNLILKLK